MNRRILLFVSCTVILAGGAILKTMEGRPSEVEKLREKHAEFLKNHPYQKVGDLDKEERKALGLPPNAFYEQKYLSEINPATGEIHKENIFEVQRALAELRRGRRVPGDAKNAWIERGPDNVGGRTRAVLFDPNDATNETVFAGGVSGGLWKNTKISDAAHKWERVGIPENLAVSCIAADPNNPKILYVGTGESYTGDSNGDGVWKSVDGGVSWKRVFGDASGASFLDFNTKMVVNSPAGIAGEYRLVKSSRFGGDITAPITGDVAVANDGTGTVDDICEDITNAAAVNGKIALIKRGGCNFDDKVLRAQKAGAIAAIVINNAAGNPFDMSGDDATITIPAMMLSQADGNKLINALGSGAVNITLSAVSGAINQLIVPGVRMVNDIVVRNNGGNSEVYVAVAEGPNKSPGTTAFIGLKTFGLYRSTDGTNFAKLNVPKTTAGNEHEPNNVRIAADNAVIMSTARSSFGNGGGEIFRSTDGVTFTKVHTVPNGARTEIALSKQDAKVAYILAQTTDRNNPVKMYKTVDSFTTVTEMALPNDADTGISATDFTRGQSFYDLLLRVDPNNDKVLYAGGIDLFKSTDAGTSWGQLSHWYGGFGIANNVHADQHGLAFASSSKMVFSNDGGVYLSTNSGTTISARNKNYNTLQFYTVGVAPTTAFGGAEYFLAGAQDNGTQLVQNATAGINSSRDVSGGDGAASFFDTDGTDRYFVTNYVYNQAIDLVDVATGRKSINSERTRNGDFINQEDLDSNLDILYSNYSVTSALDGSVTPIVMRYSEIKTGTVGKTQMTSPMMNSEPSTLKVSPYTTASSKLFVGLKNGKLLKVTNANTAAAVWADITGTDFLGSVSDVEFGENENQIFVTMHNYGVNSIWYSADGGTNWVSKEGDLPDIPVKTILQNPLNRKEVIIGTDLGVWTTSDITASSPKWVQAYNGMSNVPVLDMDLRDDNTVFAATYGRGVFSGKFTAESASVKDVIADVDVFTVYPTVSNGSFTVFAKADAGKSTIKMYNVRGQEVHRQNIDFSVEERNKVEVNLSAGIYIMQIYDAQNRKSSKKVVIE